MNARCAASVVVLGTSLLACDGAERRDAAVVLAAVARFRSADSASTHAMVAALKATPCSVVDACRVRDVCVSSGEATARALSLKSEVARALDAQSRGMLDKNAPEAAKLLLQLDEAEKLLVQGYEQLPLCDEQARALRRKHRL